MAEGGKQEDCARGETLAAGAVDDELTEES
jgi:hypothetical protein